MRPPTTLTTTDKSSTDGVSSPDLVRLWPYVPGAYGRDALYRVWVLMEEHGDTKRAFWDEAMLDTGGDLASFIKAFDGATNKLLLLIARTDTNKLCGCFWASQIQMGHQAFVGMWMQTASRGPLAVSAAQAALRYTFDTIQARHLWALTPWAHAGTLCRRMGFCAIAVLPEFCQWATDYKDVTVYRLTKEAFDGLRL